MNASPKCDKNALLYENACLFRSKPAVHIVCIILVQKPVGDALQQVYRSTVTGFKTFSNVHSCVPALPDLIELLGPCAVLVIKRRIKIALRQLGALENRRQTL